MSYLEERGKALEDAFFANKDRELMAKLKEDLDAGKNRQALKDATGIQQDDVLDRILALGVNGESLAAMSIAPLVLVAWADGKIDAQERKAIISGAEQAGLETGSHAHQLLLSWLSDQPDDTLQDGWAAYTQALCETLSAGDQVQLQETVLGRCQKVAEAAGGFLGLGSISSKEQAVLEQLKRAFEPV